MANASKAKPRSGRREASATVDSFDRAILRVLEAEARISRADLARRVGLSPPATGERVRRLEEAGIVTGYRAEIDHRRLGYALTVMIRARPVPGRLHDMAEAMAAIPAIASCLRVSGEDCLVAFAHLRDADGMEAVLDRLAPFGTTNTAIVQSAAIPRRHVGDG